MVEHEADDALGAAAAKAAADDRVDRVYICTPDKDLGQCVGGKVVQLDRRKRAVFDVDGVRAKFGVGPASIPDYLALVGDSADGFPGLPGWGAKSAAAVLARYEHLEAIPAKGSDWEGVPVRNGGKLAATLAADLELALLFRRIATIELDAPVMDSVDDLRWTAPRPEFAALCADLDAPGLAERADAHGARADPGSRSGRASGAADSGGADDRRPGRTASSPSLAVLSRLRHGPTACAPGPQSCRSRRSCRASVSRGT